MGTRESIVAGAGALLGLAVAAQGQGSENKHPSGAIVNTPQGGPGARYAHLRDGQVDYSWPMTASEGAFAVSGDIRSIGVNPGQSGQGYDLDGNATGNTYTNNTGTGSFLDGTTDGIDFNYAIAADTGAVWRFDREWQSGQFLFDTPDLTSGITYEPATNTLWTNNGRLGSGANQLRQYTVAGTLLNTIGYDVGRSTMALAFSPSEDSFWLFSHDGSGLIYELDHSGNQLSSIQPGVIDVTGAEFPLPTPAPGVGVVLVLGGLFASRRRC